MKKRYLVLQDGTVFEGYAFGADKQSIGELVFSTNVVGYIETLTDACHYGQIVMQTFPAMGNYGIIESDFIGKANLLGYVVREYCDYPSNFRCEYDLDTFLKNNNIPGIYGVDTREITTIIRDKGTMNAMICDEVPACFDEIAGFGICDAVKNTADTEIKVINENADKTVAVVNLGCLRSIPDMLTEKGYKVVVLPYNSKAEDILSYNPDGVVISEGAGNPEECEAIEEIGKLFGKVPMLGIGLGHQLMALYKGAKTFKLHYGHHGGNLPVKIVGTARTLITSQNHNYAVCQDSIKCGKVTLVNLNDNTVEGIEYEGESALGVQFEPEADFITEKFIKVMEEFNNAAE